MTTVLDRALGYRNEVIRNRIVNSAMMVSQENGSTAGTVSGYFPADQWHNSAVTGGTFTYAQVASVTPGGSPNRIRFTVTAVDTSIAAGDVIVLGQVIEGYRLADFRIGSGSAKTITIRFGVKAPAGTYCLALENGAQNRNYIAEYVISSGEANTDVVKTVTIALDQSGTWLADSGIGLRMYWVLMAGSTYQGAANAWQAGNLIATANQFNLMGTNGNVFELFDVGLYEGAVAPVFQVQDYVRELADCMRYYVKMDNVIVDVSATADNIFLPVPMRVTPTVTGGGAGFSASGFTNGATCGYAVQTTRATQNLVFNARP